MARTFGIFFFIIVLTTGCAMNGSARIHAKHFSVAVAGKDNPDQSYSEAVFERVSEGEFKRRVVGWTDRAS